MTELITLLIALVVLALGIPIGDYLAKITKEELKSGRRWFRLIVLFALIGAFISLILGEDAVLFALLFIAIVTSRSLKKGKTKNKGKMKRK